MADDTFGNEPRHYKHWREVPQAAFKQRWPDFSPQEIACKGTPANGGGEVLIDPPSLDKLQALRTQIGAPIIITSAYRTPAHNRHVGGASASQHLEGKAFDCVMANHNPGAFETAAIATGFSGIGHYPNSNFMHIDTRESGSVVRWKGKGKNNAWFKSDPGTPDFTPPARPKPVIDTAKELAPVVAPLLPGAGALASGEGPVQYAIAIVAVIAVLAALVWVFVRKRGTDRDA